MATATLKNNVLVTAGYGDTYRKPVSGPGQYKVSFVTPARVGYEGKTGTVQVTQADLDNQPVDLIISE